VTTSTKITTAASAVKNVFSTLASYLESDDEFPNDLALTIGGCLIEHIDACGDDANPDIKRLYDACGERMMRMNGNKTVDLHE
jgi:hypothetical protein